MDRELIEKLIELVGPDEQAELKVLYNSYVKTLNAYKSDEKRPADLLRANREAKKALTELVEQLKQRHITGSKRLVNGAAALKYLKSKQWKIEKSRLYADKKKGLIRFNSDKSVDKVELLAYAANYLDKIRADGPSDEQGQLAEERIRKQNNQIDVKTELAQFELDRAKKKYILRNRWLAELVAKLKATKNAALSVVHVRAPELIAAVGGDLKKQSMFIELASAYLEDAFDELANVKEIKVQILQDDKRD